MTTQMPKNRHCAGIREKSGFTMIEMLVTLTIFGIVLSSLVVGLRTGILTWRSIRSSQAEHASSEQAFDHMRADFEALSFISEDILPLVESAEEFGGERLMLTVLSDRNAQRVGAGSSWAEVEYRVAEDEESDSVHLMREVRPKVGPSAVTGSEASTTLLAGVDSIEFSYLRGQETLPVWEEEDTVPAGIEIVIHMSSGQRLRRVFPVPTGYLQAMAGS